MELIQGQNYYLLVTDGNNAYVQANCRYEGKAKDKGKSAFYIFSANKIQRDYFISQIEGFVFLTRNEACIAAVDFMSKAAKPEENAG